MIYHLHEEKRKSISVFEKRDNKHGEKGTNENTVYQLDPITDTLWGSLGVIQQMWNNVLRSCHSFIACSGLNLSDGSEIFHWHCKSQHDGLLQCFRASLTVPCRSYTDLCHRWSFLNQRQWNVKGWFVSSPPQLHLIPGLTCFFWPLGMLHHRVSTVAQNRQTKHWL